MYVYACIYQSSHQVLWTEGYLINPPHYAANIVTLQESLYDCIWTAMAAVSEQY